jgi:asparagine synthase (glutamine-hydrolysing)
MRAMCGIAGIWDPRAQGGPDALADEAARMAESLRHRGPDADGLWCDREAGLALAHRRLSIIDLSPTGAQPMVSSCGRFVLSFNGEAYNFAELRRELEASGRRFRGHSDTEVIVEGAAQWGVEPLVKRLIGMFAMALWDREARCLYLVRDRLGIKPLYWAQQGSRLVFGSELKALRACPGFDPALDRDALALFLRLAYVPAPATIYQGVKKLSSGTMLIARLGAPLELRSYWSLEAVAREGSAARFGGSEEEAVDELDALLGDAVRRRMIADVPLGAFLSGGIDSSTVVALMQAKSAQKVRSFSIGFREAGYDEAVCAKRVAAHLGTDHTELYVEPEHARTVIPRLPDIYDEPFADASQIPTFLVAEMTRRHVAVALSGDGGDEVFGGYNRYLQLRHLLASLERLPRGASRALAAALRGVPIGAWTALGRFLPNGARERLGGLSRLGDRAHKLAFAIEGGSGDFYRRIVSHWWDAQDLVLGGAAPSFLADDPGAAAFIGERAERLQYFDTLTYLSEDILTKLDRASMAVSLEARVPLLDHRVVAFSWRLPSAWKARPGAGKYLLRRVLDRYVPSELIDRPKAGFAAPIDSWLRGPLRDWAEALIDPARLRREGLLAIEPIHQRWREHQSGRRFWQYPLWNVLMFQAWKERWLPN